MPKVYDWNGTAATQLKKIYDWNGTAATQLKKGYDHNGTTSSLIYNSEYIIFNGTAAANYTGGWVARPSANAAYSAATSGGALSMTQTNYNQTTAIVMNSVNPISFSGYNTLYFTYSGTRKGNGVFMVGVSSNRTNFDSYNTYSSLYVYDRRSSDFSGTVSLNVAGIATGYIQFSVFGSTGNNSMSVTRIWMS